MVDRLLVNRGVEIEPIKEGDRMDLKHSRKIRESWSSINLSHNSGLQSAKKVFFQFPH